MNNSILRFLIALALMQSGRPNPPTALKVAAQKGDIVSFVQATTTGQLNTTETDIELPFDNDNAQDDVIAVIIGWESSGPDPLEFKDLNKNVYAQQAIQQSAGHRSQVLICPRCAKGPNTLELIFPAPGGDHASISTAEYTPADVQPSQVATGNSNLADAGSVSTSLPSTVVQLVDSTQDEFSASQGFTNRMPFGDRAPIRQAIIDADVTAGTYDPQTTVVGGAPWAATTLVLSQIQKAVFNPENPMDLTWPIPPYNQPNPAPPPPPPDVVFYPTNFDAIDLSKEEPQ